MLDALFNLLGGSVLGVIGGCVNAWIAHKQRQSDQAHEISMAREERETRRVEAEMGLRVTEEEFSGKAFNLSQQAGNKTALSSASLKVMLEGGFFMRAFGGVLAFLLGLTDAARSAVRPGITIYLAVVCTNMLDNFIKQTGGVGIETRQEIVQYAIKSEFQLLNTCVSWWFGYRMTTKLMHGGK